jgi:hypothetical protein
MKILKKSLTLAAIYTVCGVSLVSCGGGSGSSNSSANTEIINGIAVPPEPDPVQNNATIAGVDVNGNGVRDDIEREIARSSSANHNWTVIQAKNYEILLSNDVKNHEQAMQILKSINCDESGEKYLDLHRIYFNTPDREEQYYKVYAMTQGKIGNLNTFCGR